MSSVEISGIQLQKRPGIKRIVVKLSHVGRFAIAPAQPQPSVRSGEAGVQKGRRAPCRVKIPRVAKRAVRLGKRSNHQRIPGGQHLVVAVQRRAAAAEVKQPFTQPAEALRLLFIRCVFQQVCDASALKVAGFGNAVPAAKARRVLRAERLFNRLGREQVVRTLLAAAVGVLSAVKRAFGACQLPQDIIERAARGRLPKRPAVLRKRVQICIGEQGVVIEHFFKMRRKPPPVGGVA